MTHRATSSSELTAEASTLGWPPGKWKAAVEHGGEVFNFLRYVRNGDEVTAAIYETRGGKRLTVFND